MKKNPLKKSRSGHIINLMAAVLADNDNISPEAIPQNPEYCTYGIDYLERDCKCCNLCNYGRDCHNTSVILIN